MLIPPGATSKDLLFWKNVEMWFAFAGIAIPIFMMLLHAYALSDRLSMRGIAGVVSSPYFAGKKIDMNDGQLKSFLEGLPDLIVVGFSFVFLRKLLSRFSTALNVHLVYYVIFGLAFAFYLHGPGAVFLLGMVVANYGVAATLAGIKGFPVIIWIGNLGFLLITEYYHGYKFTSISKSLGYLDSYHHILRWDQVGNLCMLKVVSFLIDYHWKLTSKINLTREKHMLKCDECTDHVICLKFRMESHSNHYSLLSFVAYMFYPPLYLAGPTLTYNAWISQVQVPQQTYDLKRMCIYLMRFFLIFAILMWFVHNLYFPTIANNMRNRHILDAFTPFELIVASYFILKWIWLKFTVIWRFFRIWALFDGIESPENMGRCMSNNYGFEGFWRMWHRAFNQWLIRYIFIPLGGSKFKVVNIWIVFGFVALWHDLTLNLLAWGWGMCIFIMPEVMAKAYFASPKRAEFRKTLYYSWMCAIAGGVYICLMIIANLVGFSFGLSGLKIAIEGLMNLDGLFLMAKVLLSLTFAAHFMLMLREKEFRETGKEQGY